MAVKITVDRAAEVVAMCKKIQNSDILDLFQGVASKLEEAGVNAVTEQIFESCKNFQTAFNSYTEGNDLLIKEFEKIDEINERVKKLDIGEVSAVDNSFGVDVMDVDMIN